ncbi:hypothetical protein ENUP19_0257G0066 [Entamoeba nuttalli]|uniref:DnaJ domain containing protein n=2 Tax=Entamoeba nuttalli TaxID=412467 RepID=K2GGV2_ENTNP|nr:DnaJ domain containing protein [Entamoeba nuttalli P19]EKE41996.1 DnaJ domain containing protein [Entamoeba nuttalli P19]|eukprot:XP_008855666.1 DnaJ domain containing protein [Entamoeba nuttalli P19]
MLCHYQPLCVRSCDDPYVILGVSPSASQQLIHSRFLELTKQHHPDTHPGDSHYAKITRAYSILTDPSRKLKYDLLRSSKPVHLNYTSKSKYIIDVGIASCLPSVLTPSSVSSPILPPSCAGVTGLLLALHPIALSFLRHKLSCFDFFNLFAYNAFGWLVRPKIACLSNRYLITNLFPDVLVIDDKTCKTGSNDLLTFDNAANFNGILNGSISHQPHLLFDCNTISLSPPSRSFSWIKLKLYPFTLNFFSYDGFLLGCVFSFNLFGFSSFFSLFNTTDHNKIVLSLTAALSHLF